jgi:predicted RNase H-like nuclease
VGALGVDACKHGWIGIQKDSSGHVVAIVGKTIHDVVRGASGVSIVAIDIPIGLPSDRRRNSDVLARQRVGPRRSSVFTTPPRAVLEAGSHAEATELCEKLCGYGVSQQAYALGPKILEVNDWAATAAARVVEVHPELSFMTLAGAVLREPKSTWAGFERRRRSCPVLRDRHRTRTARRFHYSEPRRGTRPRCSNTGSLGRGRECCA